MSQEGAAPEDVVALPDADTATKDRDNKNTVITVGGESIQMDILGPIVLNTDGTMSRINNWHEMTEREQQNTLRLISKRNKQRREALLAQANEGQGGDKGNPVESKAQQEL
eukprot:CAMPEP_0118951446 /NCGR_PEP_ID=MMETSP1169-20130426/53146_1 /TAXON_ID=36882 /ORGANISM="Pyramimonas obovata, Strain CCMP722" /LENGTH=110 /DNA_ID=CAMNT_0006898505 /DNA_START=292 /DNA_END=624 /DNA_ORIENTATION=-